MNNEQLLEQYYYSVIKVEGMPEFNDLTVVEKKKIRNMLGFAGYKIGVAKQNLATTIRKKFNL